MIEFAILGLLNGCSLSGYDLKKLFANSNTLYWSGNNNQIYRTLVNLLKNELVSQEVIRSENYPARKVYTITEKGRIRLREWALEIPEVPQVRNALLIQLLAADLLTPDELDDVLDKYAEEVNTWLLMICEQKERAANQSAGSARFAIIRNMIWENEILFYKHELSWLEQLRNGLSEEKASVDAGSQYPEGWNRPI